MMKKFWKWIKHLWKKLTGDKEKIQTNTSKNNEFGSGSNLNQVNVSDKSSVSNNNNGGSYNTYYNINNLGRDVIINNVSHNQPEKNCPEISSQAKKDVVKNYNMNDKKVPCDGCGILKEPFFLDEYSNGKRYCIRCR